jgi:hypothetical protein
MMKHFIQLNNNIHHRHHYLLKLLHRIQIHFVNQLVVENQYQVNFLVQKIKFKFYKRIYVNLNVLHVKLNQIKLEYKQKKNIYYQHLNNGLILKENMMKMNHLLMLYVMHNKLLLIIKQIY